MLIKLNFMTTKIIKLNQKINVENRKKIKRELKEKGGDTKSKSNSGRKPKDISERLCAKTWYYYVKSIEGLSDQKLNEKFVTDLEGNVRSGPDHIRAFGKIRREGVMPSKSHPKRNFNLIAHVDETPKYYGSAKLIESPFWKLFRKTEFDLAEVRDIIIQCVEAFDLASIPESNSDDIEAPSYLESIADYYPEMPISEYLKLLKQGDLEYDEALGNLIFSSKKSFSLDTAAFVIALGYEAKLANKIDIAKDHMKYGRMILEEFFRYNDWIHPITDELTELVVSRMNAVLMHDLIKAATTYKTRIAEMLPNANMNSQAVLFLRKHERLLWQR